VNILEKVKNLNHWSAGIALLGLFFSLAPAATEVGIGVSAIGVSHYAAHRRRHPIWGALCALPVLGTLLALALLTFVRPSPLRKENRLVLERALSHPLLWSAVFFVCAMVAWAAFNPSAKAYRGKAHRQSAVLQLAAPERVTGGANRSLTV